MTDSGNLLDDPPSRARDEHFLDLAAGAGARVERIVSHGQATPAGEWLDQAWSEWVLLVAGSAAVRLEGEPEPRVLRPGDWLTIPARARHRVEWTEAGAPTIWLAVHFAPGA